jgi:hypothetical protein
LGDFPRLISRKIWVVVKDLFMKKLFFKTLAKINKIIMPRFSQRDLQRLSKFEKGLVAYRYWVTLNALD